jgi:GH24 family phage-related lysozyme (muramidase)
MDIVLFQQLTVPAEAERARVYDDATGKTIGPGTLVVGNPSIGIGRNVGPTGPGLRESEMVSMLDNDELAVERDAKAFAWYPKLSPIRQTVVACMIFNLGLPRFSGFHNTINDLAIAVADVDPAEQRQAFQRVHDDMLLSHWAARPPVGVGARATRLAEILLADHA